MGLDPEAALGDESSLYNQLNDCGSTDSIINWYRGKVELCFTIINAIREKANKKIIEKAKEFIQQNYNKDITLEIVANYVHLSPTYLSKLFKQESGGNFVDYITNYRIDTARNLLKVGIYKANESLKNGGI